MRARLAALLCCAAVTGCPPTSAELAFACENDDDCVDGFVCAPSIGGDLMCAGAAFVVDGDAGAVTDGGVRVDSGATLDGGGTNDGGATVDGGATFDGGATVDAGFVAVDAGFVDAGFVDAGNPCATPPPPPYCDGTTPGIALCFDFTGLDGASGTFVVADETSRGHDAVATAATIQTGVVGAAFVPGQLVIPYAAELSPAGGFTMEMDIHPSALPAIGDPRQALLDLPGSFGMFIQPPDKVQCRLGQGDGTIQDLESGGLVVGAWSHVACSVGPGGPAGYTAELWLDGVVVASVPHTGPQPGDGSSIFVGADAPSGGQTFQGAIDRVRLRHVVTTIDDACWSMQP